MSSRRDGSTIPHDCAMRPRVTRSQGAKPFRTRGFYWSSDPIPKVAQEDHRRHAQMRGPIRFLLAAMHMPGVSRTPSHRLWLGKISPIARIAGFPRPGVDAVLSVAAWRRPRQPGQDTGQIHPSSALALVACLPMILHLLPAVRVRRDSVSQWDGLDRSVRSLRPAERLDGYQSSAVPAAHRRHPGGLVLAGNAVSADGRWNDRPRSACLGHGQAR